MSTNGKKPRWIVDEKTGCWVWIRGLDQDGYGALWCDFVRERAHKHVYEQERGPIPPGAHLRNTCGLRNCVNPEHWTVAVGGAAEILRRNANMRRKHRREQAMQARARAVSAIP